MKFFKEKISTILTNIIVFGGVEVVERYGSKWGLKNISKSADACQFSFPANKNLFAFLAEMQENTVGEEYALVLTIVLENGKLWYVEFSCFNDSDPKDEEEFEELVKVFKDMKEYYKESNV